MKKSIKLTVYSFLSLLAIGSITVPVAIVFSVHTNSSNNSSNENKPPVDNNKPPTNNENKPPVDNNNPPIDNNKPPVDNNIPNSDKEIGEELSNKLQLESYSNGFTPNQNQPNLNWYKDRSLKNSDYMNLLNNITFSLFFKNEVGTNDPEVVKSLSGGTGWLLDYAFCKDSTNNNYIKLFIGTNFHVARHLINTNENEEYKQNDVISKGGYTKEFGLAWYENNRYTSLIYKNQRIPKTVFMAKDFIKDKNADDYVKNYLKENNKTEEYNGYFADFAVLEWDYYENESTSNSSDLSKPAKRLSIKNKIDSVINTYNSFYDRLSNSRPNEYKNRSKSTIYTDLSYIDVAFYDLYVIPRFEATTKESEINNIKNKQKELDNKWNETIFKYYSNYTLEPTNVYLYGYPWDSQSRGVPMGTVEIQDYDKPAGQFRLPRTYSHFYYTHLSWKNLNGNNNHQVYWDNKPTFSYYGNLEKTIFPRNTKTPSYGGISGSLVINDEGLFIGLVSSSYQNTTIIDNNNNYSEVGTINFVPFVNNFPTGSEPSYLPIQAYNLIDGSDKLRYPNQTKSFKDQLFKYHPNIKSKLFSK